MKNIFGYSIAGLVSMTVFAIVVFFFAVMSFGENRIAQIIGIPVAVAASVLTMRFFTSKLLADSDPNHRRNTSIATASFLVLIFLVWGIVLYVGARRSDRLCRPINFDQCVIDGQIKDIEE